MATVALEVIIRAPLAVVWAIVADHGNAEVGGGIAERVEIHMDGATPVRTLHLPASAGGGRVIERIEEVDERAHRVSYRIIDPGPVPITAYRGTFTLKPAPDGGTRLQYSAEFDGPDLTWLEATAKGNFLQYAANLARIVGAPPPVPPIS